MTQAEIQNRWLQVKNEIAKINKPHSPVVAVNSSWVGDDNDYSIFLFKCVLKIWESGEKQLALTLANTDPMLAIPLTMETLEENVKHHVKFTAEQKEYEDHYYKTYKD